MRVVLCLCVTVLGVVVASPADKVYTSKYDNVDVDRILNNGRILTNYIKCMMDEGPCTQDGRELKRTLPDALNSGCSKCNEKQKATSEKVITHLIKNRKKDWERLTKKYDPKGEYQKKYEDLAAKANVGATTAAPASSTTDAPISAPSASPAFSSTTVAA